MIRTEFEWNAWSSGMVTGCIVFGSWGLTAALAASAFALFGSMGAAEFMVSVSKGLFLSSGALVVLALAAGLVLERSSVGRARPPKVERTRFVSARGPARLS